MVVDMLDVCGFECGAPTCGELWVKSTCEYGNTGPSPALNAAQAHFSPAPLTGGGEVLSVVRD